MVGMVQSSRSLHSAQLPLCCVRSSARTLFVASLLLSAVAAAAPIVATAQTQSWQRRPAPIFRTGAPGSWDDLVVYAPRMLRRTDGNPYVDESGRYYMFYTASGTLDGLNRDATGLARSRTLFEWERALDRPIVERGPFGSYDQGDTSAVTILEEDGTFHLWFEGNARLAGGDFRHDQLRDVDRRAHVEQVRRESRAAPGTG